MSRDHATVLAGLAALTAACWAFVVRAGEHAHHGGPGVASLVAFAVMMAGMMAPSTAARLLGLVATAGRMERSGSALPAAGLFLCGYLAVWTGFSTAAAVAAPVLPRGAVAWGALLLTVGLYQFTPLKRACLGHCRAAAAASHVGRTGALRSGMVDGAFCVGSCWALMLVPLAAGSWGLASMALVTGLVTMEKVAPGGDRLASAAGALLMAAGTVALGAAVR